MKIDQTCSCSARLSIDLDHRYSFDIENYVERFNKAHEACGFIRAKEDAETNKKIKTSDEETPEAELVSNKKTSKKESSDILSSEMETKSV